MDETRRFLVLLLTTVTFTASACGGDSQDPRSLHPEAFLDIAAVPSRVTVTPDSAKLTVGDQFQLSGLVYGPRGNPRPKIPLGWTSTDVSVATVSTTGLVAAVSPGRSVIRGMIVGVGDSAIITVVAVPTGSWTFCVAAGNVCLFTGLRDVRLAAATGAAVQQTVFHTVPCAAYGFNNQNPAPGQPLHCDYGPIKTTTINNPNPSMGLPQVVTVALGSPGVNVQRLLPTVTAPVPANFSGAFRTQCSLSKYAFDDPIVYPGSAGASHLHMFFGNNGVNANSTSQSLMTTGNSTCRGGILNRSAYWMPAMYDTRNGATIVPDEATIYYKTGYNMNPASIKPAPTGLSMIVGDKTSSSMQQHIEWGCANKFINPQGSVPTTCGAGGAVRLTLIFPQCWDGQNLNSPDHKSHMAYPIYRNWPQVSSCPPTHPVPIPEITEHFDFPVSSTANPSYWRLSSDMYSMAMPGGFSAHADWMYGWDPNTMNTFVTMCLNKSLDCGVGSLGNGFDLY
ncbi:MAG: DUF1996 domain-containing protein [Gemmatimonadaceae bacterium]